MNAKYFYFKSMPFFQISSKSESERALLPSVFIASHKQNDEHRFKHVSKYKKNDEEQQEHKQFMTQAPWSLSSDKIIFIWMKKNKQVFVIRFTRKDRSDVNSLWLFMLIHKHPSCLRCTEQSLVVSSTSLHQHQEFQNLCMKANTFISAV